MRDDSFELLISRDGRLSDNDLIRRWHLLLRGREDTISDQTAIILSVKSAVLDASNSHSFAWGRCQTWFPQISAHFLAWYLAVLFLG